MWGKSWRNSTWMLKAKKKKNCTYLLTIFFHYFLVIPEVCRHTCTLLPTSVQHRRCCLSFLAVITEQPEWQRSSTNDGSFIKSASNTYYCTMQLPWRQEEGDSPRSTSALPLVLGHSWPMPISASQCHFELARLYIIMDGRLSQVAKFPIWNEVDWSNGGAVEK